MSGQYALGCVKTLYEEGFDYADALALRRISMTLHRWHELECGDSNDYGSWTVARGKKDKRGVFEYDDDGGPFIEYHPHKGETRYTRTPDKERGARKRLAKIMTRYPGYVAYVQGDPRGASLCILRPGDVPEGADVSSCYSRGIAVYR